MRNKTVTFKKCVLINHVRWKRNPTAHLSAKPMPWVGMDLFIYKDGKYQAYQGPDAMQNTATTNAHADFAMEIAWRK